MKTLKELEIGFFHLLEELKNDDLNIVDVLKKFESLISDFESVSKQDVEAINELKKEFKQLSLKIIKLKKIDSKISFLEESIKIYTNNLEMLFK